MGRINRYDQAQPAQDNYFNTFVPLPLDQLTALGMSRKQDLEKNQALLDKSYNDILDVKYIKDSPFEEANYRAMSKGVTDLATEFAGKDLSNPLILSEMKRRLKGVADPTLIKRMEESYANQQQYIALQMDMMSKGTWNPKLNASTAAQHNSQSGVYSELPQAYLGREKLLEPYLQHLKPSYKGINNGMMITGIDDEDINRTANSRASELKSTPGGQQEIQLFKQDYPDHAKDMSDEQIMNQIIRDYGEQYKQTNLDPLPEYMAKAMYGDSNPKTPKTPLRGINPNSGKSYDDINEIKSDIADNTKAGNTEGAADIKYSLEQAIKEANDKFGTNLTSEDYESDVLLPDPKFVKKLLYPSLANDNESKAEEYVLDKVSSITSTKYSFGFPHYDSGSLSQSVDTATSEKLGVFGLSDISNNMMANPDAYELLSINDENVPKSKKLKEALVGVNTKDLTDISIGVTPLAKNEFKPDVTFTYTDKDGKQNKLQILINDPSQSIEIYNALKNRGDNSAAEAVMQPHLAQVIATDTFNPGKPIIHKVRLQDGTVVPVTIERDPSNTSNFNISYKALDKNNRAETITAVAVNRIDLTSKLYDLVSRNNGQFEK